ncbi:MAG: hypothetical protein M3Y20_07405 [Actinomycetota bacterium]|nr:hypothetical protein [Actinomycetota bacterium]
MTTTLEFHTRLREAGTGLIRAHDDAKERQRKTLRTSRKVAVLRRRREVLALEAAHHEAQRAFESATPWRNVLDARIGHCPRCLGRTWDGQCRGDCLLSTGGAA